MPTLLALPAAAQEGDELDALDDLDAELDALDELDAELAEIAPAEDGGLRVRSFKGFAATEARVYVADREGRGKHEQALFEWQLELDVNLIGGLGYFFRPWVLVDALDTDLVRLEPLEGYLEYRAEHWDLRVGQFIESWGIVDAFNPLDILNRRDLAVDVLDAEPRGELGVRARVHFAGGEVIDQPIIALYAMPYWRETEFPTPDSRFAFAPEGVFFRPGETERPELEDAVLVGLRIEHTLNTAPFNADIQYIAARGPDRFPVFGIAPQEDGRIFVVPEYHGVWIAGGGFRAVPNGTLLSKFTLKGEVVYKKPYEMDPLSGELPEDYVQFAGGIDRIFPVGDVQEITVMLEYAGEQGADDAAADLRLFDRDVALRIAWAANDFARTQLELRGIVDTGDGELIGEAVFKRQLRFIDDDLRFELAGQLVLPDEDDETGLLARFPDPSRVDMRLQWDY